MKRIILLTVSAILISLSLEAQNKKPLTLTVTYVHREENKNEILAKSKGKLFRSDCNLPDSIKLGSVLIAYKYKGQNDCICLFKRVKK